MKFMKKVVLASLLSAAALAQAQNVKIVGLVELSGTGTTSGTNFDNGIKLAVKEINAAGGICSVDFFDSQFDAVVKIGA